MKFITSTHEYRQFFNRMRIAFAAAIGQILQGDEIPGLDHHPQFTYQTLARMLNDGDFEHLGVSSKIEGLLEDNGGALCLSLSTEEENRAALAPYFPSSDKFTILDKATILGTNFNGSVYVPDEIQASLRSVLLIVTLDGHVFEQLVLAAWIAKNLQAILLITTVPTGKATLASLNELAAQEGSDVPTSPEYQLATDASGIHTLVDENGDPPPPAIQELPEGLVTAPIMVAEAVVDSTEVYDQGNPDPTICGHTELPSSSEDLPL